MKRWDHSSILAFCASFVIAHAQAPSPVTVSTTEPMVVGAIAADGQAQGPWSRPARASPSTPSGWTFLPA